MKNEETRISTSSSPTTHDEDGFVCECDRVLHSACKKEVFYKQHFSKRYCILHYPSPEKRVDFQKVLEQKIKEGDFNFQGVIFPDDVSFNNLTFSTVADFHRAYFSAYADFTYYPEKGYSTADFSFKLFSE